MAEEKKKKTSRTVQGRSKNSDQNSAKKKRRKTAISDEQIEYETKNIKEKSRLHDEIWAVVFIALGLFLVLSLHLNAMGVIGDSFKVLLFGLFGKVAFVLAYFLIFYGILVFAQKTAFMTTRSLIACIVLFICLTCIFSVNYVSAIESGLFKKIGEVYKLGPDASGVIGLLLGGLMYKLFSSVGLYIICIAGSIISLLFIINTPISSLIDNRKINKKAKINIKSRPQKEPERETQLRMDLSKPKSDGFVFSEEKESVKSKLEQKEEKPEPKLDLAAVKGFDSEPSDAENTEADETTDAASIIEPVAEIPKFEEYPDNQKQILTYVSDDSLFGITSKDIDSQLPEAASDQADTSMPIHTRTRKSSGLAEEEVKAAKAELEESIAVKAAVPAKYKFPPISLLSSGTNKKGSSANLAEKAELLEQCLESFGVEAKVTNYIQGPAVTRFEVQPAVGVKVSSIVRLQNDIALNLRAKSIRIEAPIPGKAAVGIEISNESISTVYFKEVLDSKDFKDSKSKVSVALGRSISGDNVIMDIKKMPHMLIAGTTGSGKSVCINTILLSLLYKADPDQVKLILIDPKVVELSDYNGIPHLMLPVVTDPAKASAALSWAVSEMNERYNKFAEEGGVKDLESYNEKVRANLEEDKVMPQIVIIVDELADLIMAAKNSVEDSICRLAQKARAAGMHIIIATQTPRSDVLTGVIKANLPSKIALAVSTALDSRIILDESGAECLLGKGDMLYAPQDFPKPLRVQGCYVDEKDVTKVIDYIKEHNVQDAPKSDILVAMEKAIPSTQEQEEDLEDELLLDAIECVVFAEQCSVSMLQRRFRIGYNRSARIVDLMEERGIVGPADGARPRKVLMTKEEFAAMNENLAIDVPEEI